MNAHTPHRPCFTSCLLALIVTLIPNAHAATLIEDVLNDLERVDTEPSAQSTETISDLTTKLLAFTPIQQAKEADRLSYLATQAQHSQTRTAAFAAWITGTASATEAQWLAHYSPSVLLDFLRAVSLVNDENTRNGIFDFIYDLAKSGSIDSRLPITQRSAIQLESARALASMTIKPVERIALLTELMAAGTITEADTIPPVYPDIVPPKPRAVVEYWTLDMLKNEIDAANSNRSFASGKEMFRVASCLQCHVIAGEGLTIGPDLTEIAKLYDAPALLEHILDPSLKIDDEYKSVIIEMKNKKEHFGTILSQDDTSLSIVENVLKPETAVTLQKSDIKLIDPIELSPMPQDLLITLNKNEIWDLIAYLLSPTDPNHTAFSK